MDACSWREKMGARCGGDKLGITLGGRIVICRRPRCVVRLPDVRTRVMFIRGDEHRASIDEP
ncbi:MAG: hypothetical protein ACYC3F_04635 [Gemmatimonadaceae bacterium]